MFLIYYSQTLFYHLKKYQTQIISNAPTITIEHITLKILYFIIAFPNNLYFFYSPYYYLSNVERTT